MKNLNKEAKSVLSKCRAVQKTNHRFSTMPLDHTHEQEIEKVKGKGGIIGLTEDQKALKKWIISAPEKARIPIEFEKTFNCNTNPEIDYRRHVKGMSNQITSRNIF